MSLRTTVKQAGSGILGGSNNRTKLVIGLGNIGDDYATTRHNIGFMVVDQFVKKHDLPEFKKKGSLNAEISEGQVDGRKVIVAKPNTYMNLSGKAAYALMEYYKVVPEDIVVVSDELDLDFGQIRSRSGGGPAGHKGVASVIALIGEEFYRVRLGINNGKPERSDTSTFVLKPFNRSEHVKLPKIINKAQKLVDEFVSEQIQDTTTKV